MRLSQSDQNLLAAIDAAPMHADKHAARFTPEYVPNGQDLRRLRYLEEAYGIADNAVGMFPAKESLPSERTAYFARVSKATRIMAEIRTLTARMGSALEVKP